MTLCNAKLTRTSGTSSPIVESSRRPPSRPSSASAKTRHAPGHGLSASRASAAPSPGRATTSIASLPTSRAARMRTSTPHLTITLWRSQYARHGRCEELTWREFVGKYVARPEIARTKTSVAGFSIATFHGNRRALANVECVYALGLDFDRGDTTIDQAARLWRGSMGVAYTTWSHEPTTPRLRGVIVLSRPVSADEYARIWTWAADRSAKAGHVVDSAARDASRFWFVPSHRPGAEFMFRELHGSPLDVEAVLRAAPLCAVPGRAAKGGTRKHHGTGAIDRSDSGADWLFVLARMRAGETDREIARALRRRSPKATERDDYLHRTIERARVSHEANLTRVTVARAMFESRPAWESRPPLVRWVLDLVTPNGEVLRARVALPTAGYESARETFRAVFPGVRWTSSLGSIDGWRRRGLLPLRGRQLDVAVRGAEVTWMRAASNPKITPRTLPSRVGSSPRRAAGGAR